MEKHKKIVALVMIILLGVVAVSGCIGSSEEKSSDGLKTYKMDNFEFKAPDEFEWDVSMSGNNGWLKNDNLTIAVDADIDMLSFADHEGEDKIIDGITTKIDTSMFDGDTNTKNGRIIIYFEKNDTIFSIMADTIGKNEEDKKYVLKVAETIIKTMTPT